MNKIFLESAKRQFLYYKSLGEQALAQVPDDKLTWSPNGESNSLAVIVKHLWGNMLSRWTNFLTEDGEKSWRDRDGEFEGDLAGREMILDRYNEGWAAVFAALNAMSPEDVERTVYIREQAHSVVEAIQRQTDHYAYHVGQMVYLAKMIVGADWKSLSIPKGKSSAFNQAKMAQGKHGGHFTDDLVR